MILKRLGDCEEPLYGDDHHPDHRHGDGDALDRMCYVRNNCEEPFTTLDVSNDDIINYKHDDQEAVNDCQHYQVLLEMGQDWLSFPHFSQN